VYLFNKRKNRTLEQCDGQTDRQTEQTWNSVGTNRHTRDAA